MSNNPSAERQTRHVWLPLLCLQGCRIYVYSAAVTCCVLWTVADVVIRFLAEQFGRIKLYVSSPVLTECMSCKCGI